MKKNELYEVKILDDNHNGCGIGKINDIPIFISNTLKDEEVKVRITKINKKYLLGEVVSFIKKSTLREEIKCKYYNICGGCDTLHLSYDRENELKKKYIEKLFKQKTSIEHFNRFNYRNKITLHVRNGICGLYKKESNDIINIDNCLLVSKNINDIIKIINTLSFSNLKEITIKEANNKILISLNGNLDNNDIEKLKNNKNVKSIYQNNKLIYKDKYIEYNFDNIKYLINNNAFFQVNTECAKKLYSDIKEYIKDCNSLLDLYCGTASIGIYVSDVCKEIKGIEINEDSVLCAKENFKLNNINNYEILKKDASFLEGKYDYIVVDPPRSGLNKKVINKLNEIKGTNIIYVSCNPNTLKRDINLLNNYELKEIKVYNMFPCTKHMECLSLLTLKK